jgi:hypothetical protein
MLILLLTGCTPDPPPLPVKLCDGTVVDRNSWNSTVNIAYHYGDTYYVENYDPGQDYALFNRLHDREAVKVYASGGYIEGIVQSK